jgi:hypothetical protein
MLEIVALGLVAPSAEGASERHLVAVDDLVSAKPGLVLQRGQARR